MKSHKLNVILVLAAGMIIASVATIFTFSASVTKADGLESPSVLQAKIAEIKALVDSLVEEPALEPTFGAVSVLNSPLEVNGTTEYFGPPQNFKTGTSTICSFKTPNATTTGGVVVRAKTIPYAFGYQIAGSAASNTATTTDYGFIANPANSVGISSTTLSISFPPNFNINVKVATTSGTTVDANFTPTGTCVPNFRVI
jgi:hypothetical protein